MEALFSRLWEGLKGLLAHHVVWYPMHLLKDTDDQKGAVRNIKKNPKEYQKTQEKAKHFPNYIFK